MSYSLFVKRKTVFASLIAAAVAASIAFGASGNIPNKLQYHKKDGKQWKLIQKNADGSMTVIDGNAKQPDIGDAASVSAKNTILPRQASAFSLDAGSALSMNYYPAYEAYPIGSWPEAVAIGDLNLDGRNDVVITTSTYSDPENDKHVFVFYQSENGTLNPPIKFPASGKAITVDIADLNNDGLPDIIVGNDVPQNIEIFLQNQTGNFISTYTIPTTQSNLIRAADLNSDGLIDFTAMDWSTKRVEVYVQKATGGFALDSTYFANYEGWNDCEVGDINGDGKTDIAISSGQGFSDDIHLLFQNSFGNFDSVRSYFIEARTTPQGITIGSVTGDSRTDVIVTYGGNSPTSYIGIFAQKESGAFDSIISYASYDCPEDITTGDANLDGLTDLYVVHGGWNKVGVYLQNPDGSLNPEQLFSIPYASHYNPNGLAVGDINSDGSVDIVIADYNNGLIVLRNAFSRIHASFVASPASGESPLMVAFNASTSHDPEGDPLTYAWNFGDGAAASGMIVSHSYNVKGTYIARLIVADGSGNADTAFKCITVNNSAPRLSPLGDMTIPENGTLQFTLQAYDGDGDALTFVASGLPAGAAFNSPTATFTWQPGFDQAGVYPNITFTVSDGAASDTETITITVTNTNRPPIAADDAVSTDEDVSLSINVLGNDNDPDGDALHMVSVQQPLHGAAIINVDNTITYVPSPNYSGPDQFSYVIADNGEAAASANVTVSVLPVNDPPTVAITSPIDGAVFQRYRSVFINAAAMDIDGTVAKVVFYRDGYYLGQDKSSPYTGVWWWATPGTHTLYCKAYDNNGAITQSASVSIIVQ